MKPPAAEEWKRAQEELSHAYGRVELLIDGYRVLLTAGLVKPLRYEIYVYINGEFKGVWLRDDCEERRRFARPIKWSPFTPKVRRGMKRAMGKRGAELCAPRVYYGWSWPLFGPLKRHLVANNQDIRIERVGLAEIAP